MIVISHRGFWKNPNEKNSLEAFELSLSLGIGIEVDIRDFEGGIVISHDVPDHKSPKSKTLLDIYLKYPTQPLIAFNVKSDGLQKHLYNLLEDFKLENYFIFDSSVPDAIQFLKLGITTLTRQSEYETSPSFYDLADGVWLDQFSSDWINEQTIKFHYNNGKKICIVSPELHAREYKLEWEKYKKILIKNPKIKII